MAADGLGRHRAGGLGWIRLHDGYCSDQEPAVKSCRRGRSLSATVAVRPRLRSRVSSGGRRCCRTAIAAALRLVAGSHPSGGRGGGFAAAGGGCDHARQPVPESPPAQFGPILHQFPETSAGDGRSGPLQILDAGQQTVETGRRGRTWRRSALRSADAKASRWSSQTSQSWMSPKQRLHLLDRFDGLVEPARIHGTAYLQGISQPLGRDPHGVVALAVVRIGQTVLVLEQFVQLAEHVPLGPRQAPRGSAGPRAAPMPTAARIFLLARRISSQNALGFQTADRLDDLPLQPLAVALQLHQHAGNARKTFLGVQRRQGAAEQFDLHVAVAGIAQRRGDPPDRFPPAFDAFAGEAAVEHPQRRPQPPRGDPRTVDELDVFGARHAVQLLGKLLRLPADVMCGEYSIACVHSLQNYKSDYSRPKPRVPPGNRRSQPGLLLPRSAENTPAGRSRNRCVAINRYITPAAGLTRSVADDVFPHGAAGTRRLPGGRHRECACYNWAAIFASGTRRPRLQPGQRSAVCLPGRRRGEIRRPERPRAALPRPGFVDPASAACVVEEHAIAVGQLDEALANAHRADVSPLELLDREAHGGGQRLDLGPIDPHVARLPVQQSPQPVQANFRPSRYQGSFMRSRA